MYFLKYTILLTFWKRYWVTQFVRYKMIFDNWNFDLYNITTIILYSAGFKCTENSVVINSIIDDGGGNKEKKNR